MSIELKDRCIISAFQFGSICSYELQGEYIVARFLGLMPIRRFHLGAVYYLRLASRSEVPPHFLLFNWLHFLSIRRARRPIYVLQTRSTHHRIFLKMESSAHFRLRQAIARFSNTTNRTHEAA